MNPDDLAKLLDELAKRLDAPSREAFALLVRYQTTQAAVWLGCLLLVEVALLIGIVVTMKYINRWWAAKQTVYDAKVAAYRESVKSGDKYGYKPSAPDAEDVMFPRGLVLVFGGMFVVIAALPIPGLIVTLLNPEYAAVRDLLSVIGGAR